MPGAFVKATTAVTTAVTTTSLALHAGHQQVSNHLNALQTGR